MSQAIQKLNDLLQGLQRDESLRKRIDFLERELKIARSKAKPVVEENSEHLEKLRDRIKELEQENHELKIRMEAIKNELRR